MIKPTPGFTTSSGKLLPLEDAQVEEIGLLLSGGGEIDQTTKTMAQRIVENREKVVDVLTTTASSRPSARAVNGGSKPRKKKAAPAEPQLIPAP